MEAKGEQKDAAEAQVRLKIAEAALTDLAAQLSVRSVRPTNPRCRGRTLSMRLRGTRGATTASLLDRISSMENTPRELSSRKERRSQRIEHSHGRPCWLSRRLS